MEVRHLFRDNSNCKNNKHGKDDPVCGCKFYWKKAEEVTEEVWLMNHDVEECIFHGGGCAK